MSSPPPPWESHPPLSDDDFYEADPDVDTGPVHVVTPTDQDIAGEDARAAEWPQAHRPPPAEEDTFAGRFTAPLTIAPRTVPVKANRVRLGPIVAGVAGSFEITKLAGSSPCAIIARSRAGSLCMNSAEKPPWIVDCSVMATTPLVKRLAPRWPRSAPPVLVD